MITKSEKSAKKRRSARIIQDLAVVLVPCIAGWVLFACTGTDAPIPPNENGPPPVADAGVEASDRLDAGNDAADVDAGRTCTTDMPFRNHQAVGSLNTTGADEFAPSLTSDEKTIVFTRANPPGTPSHLYMATRASTDVDFDPPTLVPGLSDFSNPSSGLPWLDGDGRISASGDKIIFTSNRNSANTTQILYAQMDHGVFGTPALFLPNWTADGTRSFLTSDGSEFFFQFFKPALCFGNTHAG